MKRCPVCKAGLKGADICRRCGMDLSAVRKTADAACGHYRAAWKACRQRDPQTMLAHARQAHSKCKTLETCCLLACAAMLCGDYDTALKTWRRLG